MGSGAVPRPAVLTADAFNATRPHAGSHSSTSSAASATAAGSEFVPAIGAAGAAGLSYPTSAVKQSGPAGAVRAREREREREREQQREKETGIKAGGSSSAAGSSRSAIGERSKTSDRSAAAGVQRSEDRDREGRGAGSDRDRDRERSGVASSKTASAAYVDSAAASYDRGERTVAAAAGTGGDRSGGRRTDASGGAPSGAAPGSITVDSAVPSRSPTRTSSSSKKSDSKKKVRAPSKKKLRALQEQANLTDVAAQAAALLAEKKEIEERLAAREAREKAEAAHASRVVEAGRLYTEAESDVMYEREREGVLGALEDAVYEAQEWDNYLACNPLPDVREPAQLNAFVSVFRERDEINAPHVSLDPTLHACAQAELVVGELELRAALAREEKQDAVISECDTYIRLLRDLIRRKLDALTCKFLSRNDEYETGEDVAFTLSAATPSVQFGVWVHGSSRTNRIKRIDFTNAGNRAAVSLPNKGTEALSMDVSIELPQSLQKARTAIRLIRTLYDSVAVIPQAPKVAAGASAGTEADTPAFSRSGTSTSRPGTRGDGGLAKLLTAASSSSADVPAVLDEALSDPTSLFDFNARPPPLHASTHFVSLGGVLDLQQVLLPPPAKRIKSWTMREITALDRTVVNVPYPSEEALANAAAQGTSASSNNSSLPSLLSSNTALAPLRVRFTLPPHIFLPDAAERQPLFGYWDASAHKGAGAWKQDGVSILEWDPRARSVCVSLPTIKPLAVIQPRALDFPYRSWSLMPVRELPPLHEQEQIPDVDDFSSPAAHTCRLEVVGSRFVVGFEIQGLAIRLVSPSHAFLREREILDRWFASPGALMNELKHLGLNVSPDDADAVYCRKPLKAPVLIQTLHSHLALLTQIYDVSFSRHNVSRSANSATVRVRLNKHSLVLATAAQRKAQMDWAAAEAEAERRDMPDTSYENFPASMRSHEPLRDQNGNPIADPQKAQQNQDAIDMQIREMEAEEVAAALAERTRKEEEARKAAADEAAAAAATAAAAAAAAKARSNPAGSFWPKPLEDLVRPAPPPLTTAQKHGEFQSTQQMRGLRVRERRMEIHCAHSVRVLTLVVCPCSTAAALGFEWVTVLAELIDAPSDPALASSAAMAAGAASSAAASAASKGLSKAELRVRGSAHEELPPGVLLRFTLIRGDDKDGACDQTPLAGCVPHFSLRRCLLSYFADKTPHDLTTAMAMATPNFGIGSEAPTAQGSASQQYHFLPFEPITLQTQQTVRRTLNLLRPLIFC